MNKILHQCYELYGAYCYDTESVDYVVQFVREYFPGNYTITINYYDDDKPYTLSFEFDDPAEELMFRLKYS